MPTQKHNMFAMKLVGIIVSILSLIVGAFAINWGGVIQFGHSANFLYENVEELEHVLDDFHEILVLKGDIIEANRKIDSLNTVLFKVSNRDSLIHVIELLNEGKYPYDSIWHRGPSGYQYETTITKHFTEEHDN